MLKEVLGSRKSEIGRVVEQIVDSEILKGNKAGIDSQRNLSVYLPTSAQKSGEDKFPVLYLLAPWTSSGRVQFSWQALREPLFDQINRLISSGKLPPTIIVCPDLYTYFGGSQYIDSDYLGFHGSFIVKELIPYIEANFPVLTGSAHRGVFGRSSGGYGALRLSMDFPGVFSAVACHSGDLGFDTAMRRDLIDLCKVLERFDGDSLAFLKYCQEAKKLSGQEVHALMLHGMGATYSPNPHSQLGFDLPINLYTGEILDDIWQKWCDHDPVVGIDRQEAQGGLKALKYLYLDCGKRDQFNLLYGARQFSAKLTDLAIEHDYQEFNDNHSGTAYRYDISLPPMLRALVKK